MSMWIIITYKKCNKMVSVSFQFLQSEMGPYFDYVIVLHYLLVFKSDIETFFSYNSRLLNVFLVTAWMVGLLRTIVEKAGLILRRVFHIRSQL